MTYPKRVIILCLLIVLLLTGGTLGYALIEHYELLDAFYMTVITVSLVGFGYLHQLEPSFWGKVFISGLILLSLGFLGYAAHTLSAFIVEGELNRFFRRTRMERKIAALRDHYIVCGLGRTGRIIVEQLRMANVPFVAVDHNPEAITRVDGADSILFVNGNATEDSTLESCGIDRASGLLAALDSDVDNLYIVLSAREKNPKLQIVARATTESVVSKMRKAGANNVITPSELGAIRMASAVLRPQVVSFLDVMTRSRESELTLEQVTLPKASSICGKSLKEASLPQRTGLIVIGLLRMEENEMLYNPTSDTVLSAGDTLIVLGRTEQVGRLRRVVAE